MASNWQNNNIDRISQSKLYEKMTRYPIRRFSMLKITADIFSGRPNPKWIVTEDDARQILEQVSKNTDSIDFSDTRMLGLGYRGLILEPVSEDLPRDLRLPTGFRVSNTTAAGQQISKRIIESMSSTALPHIHSGGTDLTDVQHLLKQENAVLRPMVPAQVTMTSDQIQQHIKLLQASIDFLSQAGCNHEEVAFDPNFWNDPSHVGHNNFYNFSTNRRTDTFAQPGRASGQMFTSVDCEAVKAAAIRDGAITPSPCPPDDQIPRYWIALVIAPNWPDYHWYRRCSDGFWAHKPGGTPARNTDNSGQIILDPENCNRGPYTDFCGYLYTQKKMNVN